MIQLERKKKWNFKLSLAYKLQKFIPLTPEKKLKLFLDLSWIFGRLAHEQFNRTNLTIKSDPAQDFLATKIQKDFSILDIGCGHGFVMERILHKTQNIVGIDYNVDSVALVKEKFRGTKMEVICLDVFDYFKLHPDRKFDVIILSHVLEHIDEPTEFLKLISPKARFFYIEVPDLESSHLNVYRAAVNTDLIYTDADHVSEFDRVTFISMVESIGLSVLDFDFRFGVMKYWLTNPT